MTSAVSETTPDSREARGLPLRLRLIGMVVLAVLASAGVGVYVDYRREHRIHLEGVFASLQEQGRTLQVARRQITERDAFADYVDEFCAQMNVLVSPGHHILVLDASGRLLAHSRRHSGAEVEQVLLRADSAAQILRVGEHNLAQVRVRDQDGATFILAQYLDHMQAILRAQLLSRALTAGGLALALIGLLSAGLSLWVLRPIGHLRRAARLATGHSPSSANREVRTLKRLFNLAIMRGYLAPGQNPCLALPRIKVGRKRNAYCEPAEFQAIFRAAPNSLWRAFLVLVYTTALRLREATNLTWKDIDFQSGQVHVTRKAGGGWIQPWQPKDHEMRTLPLPDQAVSLLTAWQAVAPEECPYVFMEHGRWEYYRRQVSEGRWRPGLDLVNNFLRRFQTLCRRAGVGPYTIHDLRRSCITNWARRLPIHVVQQLAGHSEIQTTETYYLSVHEDDLAKAREVQSELVGELPEAHPTDTKLTQRGQNRGFPLAGGSAASSKPLSNQDLRWRPQEESNL